MMLVNIWKLSFKKPQFCAVIPFQERENQSLIAKISSLQDEVCPSQADFLQQSCQFFLPEQMFRFLILSSEL